MVPAAPGAQMSLIHLLAMHSKAVRGSEHQTSLGDICKAVAERKEQEKHREEGLLLPSARLLSSPAC